MRAEGVLANGAHTPGTVGDFDPVRVRTAIRVVEPILAGQNKPVPAGLAPAHLATNEFIAAGVGLDPAAPPRR
jgi:hypothetical protein